MEFVPPVKLTKAGTENNAPALPATSKLTESASHATLTRIILARTVPAISDSTETARPNVINATVHAENAWVLEMISAPCAQMSATI